LGREVSWMDVDWGGIDSQSGGGGGRLRLDPSVDFSVPHSVLSVSALIGAEVQQRPRAYQWPDHELVGSPPVLVANLGGRFGAAIASRFLVAVEGGVRIRQGGGSSLWVAASVGLTFAP
jgi:hypothetical protein